MEEDLIEFTSVGGRELKPQGSDLYSESSIPQRIFKIEYGNENANCKVRSMK